MRDDETLDALTSRLSIHQKKAGAFRFGLDSVLLADFARARRGGACVDLGTGAGVIPILMADRDETIRADAVEILPEMADMAGRNVEMCGMAGRIRVFSMDLMDAARALGYEKYDLATCNPPYGKSGCGDAPQSAGEAVARVESVCGIGEIARAAASLLRQGGRFAAVFPAARLYELMRAMESANLSPKRARLVQHDASRRPILALLDSVKGGGSGLEWMPTLFLRDGGGAESDEYRRIYRLGEGAI